jgi:hypothetical protein
MVWAQKRKMAYMSGVLLFFGIIALLTYRKVTNVASTCFDHKQNGAEVGIDCGGGCLQYCPNELTDPKVRWARSFVVTPGIVHAVAYIEHSYPASSARKVNYVFKLYDAKNSLITERAGSTYLGPMGRSAIAEILIPVGNVDIARTQFSFVPPIPWERTDPLFSQIVINTDRTVLENYSGGTRLTATLVNKSRYAFDAIDTVAILYDTNDNAITASKIVVPHLDALGSTVVYFTWPQTITKASVRSIEVVPRFNVFASKKV